MHVCIPIPFPLLATHTRHAGPLSHPTTLYSVVLFVPTCGDQLPLSVTNTQDHQFTKRKVSLGSQFGRFIFFLLGCVCVCILICALMCVLAHGCLWMSSTVTPPPYLLRHGLSLNPELTNSIRLAGLVSHGGLYMCASLAAGITGVCHAWLFRCVLGIRAQVLMFYDTLQLPCLPSPQFWRFSSLCTGSVASGPR